MFMSRRFILTLTAVCSLLAATTTFAESSPPTIHVGSCMIGLEAAKQAGLEGVQIPLALDGDDLDVSKATVRERYKQQMKETGLPICALMMGVLNTYPLASDPRGPKWLDQAIDAAKDLGATSILVAFFGKGDLLDKEGHVKQADVDVVVERLKAAAGHARSASIALAIEDYLDGKTNLDILNRINEDSVQIWYDVFNTGGTKGYDVPAEVRLLKGRISQFHFKNGPKYLGEGKLDFAAIVQAIKDTHYTGWIVMETSSPTGDKVADAKRNAAFIRKLLGASTAP